ncbi:MAG: hypothetical protein L6427_02840, partial [Actinomycetia bacterium]|nr:hypothetical protein [Actinomycetes bacterium]
RLKQGLPPHDFLQFIEFHIIIMPFMSIYSNYMRPFSEYCTMSTIPEWWRVPPHLDPPPPLGGGEVVQSPTEGGGEK